MQKICFLIYFYFYIIIIFFFQASIYSFQPERISWEDPRRQIQANSISLLWWVEWHHYKDVKFKGKDYKMILSVSIFQLSFGVCVLSRRAMRLKKH